MSTVDGRTVSRRATLAGIAGVVAATATPTTLDAVLGETVHIVRHGADRYHRRPETTRRVMWLGSVVPFHRQAGDLVLEVTAEPAPWTPQALDLIVWHDASAGYTAGEALTRITDRGPLGHHLVTRGGTGTVTVDRATLAHPSFSFDGASWLESARHEPGTWQGPVSVYLVTRFRSLTTAGTLVDGTAGNRAALGATADGRLAASARTTLRSGTGAVAVGTTCLLSARFAADATATVSRNGRALATGEVGVTAPVRHRLGAGIGGREAADALVGEVIIARDVAPEAEADVVAYLTEKWGLA